METTPLSLPSTEQVIAAINDKQKNTGANEASVAKFVMDNFQLQGKQASADVIAQAYLDSVVNISM